ncbi:beta-galactosidase [Paraphoma chrysanthemicola]|uniref:Beta-galactosidase n=1 Tax=Paraphoma chrysanthemicola TaxID=798071 RepID=A0A8K0QSN8_9PLEO|nr:beta-galactosidase [Paraphoma chrysanthemicola]
MVCLSAFAWLVLPFVTLSLQQNVTKHARTKYNFNSDWRVSNSDPTDASKSSFDDGSWKAVTLPYAWNEDSAFRVSIDDLPTGIAWYRKHFKAPSSSTDKKIFLEFEGIRHGGDFYLNDEFIGRSDNGVMAFGFDVTDKVLQGKDNVIAARIDNSWDYKEVATGQKYQWNDKNFYANYGGINKNVYLHVTDKLYQTLPLYSNLNTTGTYVYATDIDVKARSGRVVAEAQVKNEYSAARTFTYQVKVRDMAGKTVATMNGGNSTVSAGQTQTLSASGVITGLNFWSWGYGYLYDVETTLTLDGQVVDTVTTRTGFRKTNFSNGFFKLNDQALQLKGYAQRTTNEWPALGSAVPAWLSDFSNRLILQSHGNLIRWMHVTPWKQDVESLDRLGLLQAMPAGDSEGDPTGRRWDQRVELMRDAIIYNRNNPSIVFYESGNKGITEDHMSEMKKVRDTYDPKGGRAIGSREMLSSKVAEYGGEMLYINKGGNIPFWSMEYSRDEGLRKYWDDYSPPYHRDGDGPLYNGEDAAVYNRNQDSHARENVERWFDYYEQRPGTGDRVNAGGVNIIFSDSNTHHRGAENYRRSGEVDAVRLPKDAYYANQVMWNNWVDADVPATHLVGHWNYNTSVTKDVYVISTAKKVELLLNGKSLGFGNQTKTFFFTFPKVKFAAGELKAVGYDGNTATSNDTRTTAGTPAGIRLTSHVSPSGFVAHGADIALVDVEVVDANGKRVPTALNTINFELSGAATWRGGIAQGPDNYILAKSLPVENGVNRVMLRSTTTAGRVTLKATADGLASASVDLTSTSFQVTDGLSTTLPSAGLKSDMSRGPTPNQPLKIKRKSIKIASSEPSAGQSYDDNEETAWTGTGPVTYKFAAQASVSQATIKVPSHRSKSYPVTVAVNGKQVFSGRIGSNLGYSTLSWNATVGSNVTISSGGNFSVAEVDWYTNP